MSLFLILVAVTANPYPQDCFGLGNRASIAWARFSGLGTRSSCCVPFRRITSAAWGTQRTVWWLAWTHKACGCLFPVLGQTDILIASLWLWQTIQWKRFTVAHSSKVQSIMAEKARQEEHEAAGHGASTARRQRDGSWGPACFLLLIQIHRDSFFPSPINLI